MFLKIESILAIFCQEENDLFKIMIAILELYWENEELTAVRHDWVHEHLRNLKVLHLGWHTPKQKYNLSGEWIEISPGEKVQWVFVGKNLNMIQPHALAAQKASCTLCSIQSSVANKKNQMILSLYSALMRPTWSTASSFGVHGHPRGYGPARLSPEEATKMIRGLKDLSQRERLRPLRVIVAKFFVLKRTLIFQSISHHHPDSTELCQVMLPSVQGLDLDRLDTWPAANHLEFNTSKCQVLHLDQGNPKDKHTLHGERIENIPAKKSFGDKKLDMNWPRALTAQKANYTVVIQSLVGSSCGRGFCTSALLW
ncbi:hypothetical protein HGM15179_009962 [Zosterops borbonicus]|uniref:Uncharacterized protein n=1 Tax=Zosterops borbonicus TaxID=364589 RepID=A0A8K1GFH1_9PASS|nr:hypothetical protein HGM15179_009962 [Zosterops borbonicus]